MEYVLFAFKVKIDCAVGDAGFACDVGDFGIEVTIMRKHPGSGAQDCFALISAGLRTVFSERAVRMQVK